MGNLIDTSTACALLREWDEVLILTHQKPDGDTIGSAFALMHALHALGKRARVECSDPLPNHYGFITGNYHPDQFDPRFVVSVDVANPDLFGKLQPVWEDKLDLCIDHHRLNTLNAKYKLLDPEVPSTAQLVYAIIKGLGVAFDRAMATAVFTGVSTDTGCFRYASTTADAHRVAAEMIDAGADHSNINRLMFDTRSRPQIELDKHILSTLEYHFGGLCAMIVVSREATGRLGIEEHELDGLSALPRRIEGVQIGLSLRENFGSYRVSVRTREGVDASALCAKFGGGGHHMAGGCTITGDETAVRQVLLAAVKSSLLEAGYSWS
ncbi:MAG: DHH family phosphoesterase [Oscillospiraceae bacterium]|nr:DHH family phosphoesterase [Oscillospiraceae bacterium]